MPFGRHVRSFDLDCAGLGLQRDPFAGSGAPRLRTVTIGRLALWFTTDDCRRTYEELKARGVEFTQEPVEHFYGIDVGLRDPFGNHLRVTQPAPQPLQMPEPAGQG